MRVRTWIVRYIVESRFVSHTFLIIHMITVDPYFSPNLHGVRQMQEPDILLRLVFVFMSFLLVNIEGGQ